MVQQTYYNDLDKSESTDLYSVTRTGLNANWDTVDERISKNSFDQAIDPTITDDHASWYSPGSLWFVRDPANRLFQCTDSTVGNAKWIQLYSNGNPTTLKDNWDAGSYYIRALQFQSDVVTGTAPFVVASTTKVENLNADLFDDKDSTVFVQNGQAGNIGNFSFTAANFASNVPTGTQPYATASTQRNINLNADMVDDLHASAFVWHSLATAADDFLVASASGTWTNKSLADTKHILGIDEDSTAFWTVMPGTPVRNTDTQFAITDVGNANNYDSVFKLGTILKWEKSLGGTQLAMVVDSNYAADVVTIDIVGSALGANFTGMKYCIHRAIKDVFIVPGVMPAVAVTDISKTIYFDDPTYVIAGLVRYKTAATTTGGTWDINDDSATLFTTKLVIAAGATKGTLTGSDCLPAGGAVPIAVTADSIITLDYDAGHATTPGSDAYVSLWYMPVAWRYTE